MKPKKLIRQNITSKLKEGEWETITDLSELNALYELKVREELQEIIDSGHKDINEFVDLIEVAVSFAMVNGFRSQELEDVGEAKFKEKGGFHNLALNNLNPSNPSNKIYFETDPSRLTGIELIARERKEQIEKHGRTIQRDVRENPNGELAIGASIFCLPDFGCLEEEDLMDRLPDEWDRNICEKIVSKPYKERLIIAGALLAAELDRLIEVEKEVLTKNN